MPAPEAWLSLMRFGSNTFIALQPVVQRKVGPRVILAASDRHRRLLRCDGPGNRDSRQ